MSDLIRKRDAVSAISDLLMILDGKTPTWNEVYHAIEDIPSAEPEPKKGKWIKHENPKFGPCLKIVYECSVCHKGVGCEYFLRRSFCPNCGADMREEDIPMEYFESGGK